jgi:hypothetical protein
MASAESQRQPAVVRDPVQWPPPQEWPPHECEEQE